MWSHIRYSCRVLSLWHHSLSITIEEDLTVIRQLWNAFGGDRTDQIVNTKDVSYSEKWEMVADC